MKAKKSLGQHFLKSEKALSAIIAAGDIRSTDTVLEIGPGTGILTNRLLGMAKKVIAVEKDRELITYLEENFVQAIGEKHLELLEQDILTLDTELLRFYGKQYKLIANIPYYITGAIIEKFLSAAYQPERMVLLMQKEVAERIVAKNKKEGVLSIAVRAYGAPKILATVPRGAFAPAPKVDSAILLVEGISRKFFTNVSEGLFFEVLKAVFGKKRAQIGRSLGEYLKNKELGLAILSTLDIDSKTRPEDIDLLTWKKLAQAVQKREIGVQ